MFVLEPRGKLSLKQIKAYFNIKGVWKLNKATAQHNRLPESVEILARGDNAIKHARICMSWEAI